jgi:hypothetical protein
MADDPCPTCDGVGRIACPGPTKAKTNAERAQGRQFIDWCYGMHMGHHCPDCSPPNAACVCCGKDSTRRQQPDPWEGRLDGYCDECATARCDAEGSHFARPDRP